MRFKSSCMKGLDFIQGPVTKDQDGDHELLLRDGPTWESKACY